MTAFELCSYCGTGDANDHSERCSNGPCSECGRGGTLDRMYSDYAAPPKVASEATPVIVTEGEDERRLSMARDQLTAALNLRGHSVPAGRWGWACDHGVWLLKLAEKGLARPATSTLQDQVEAYREALGEALVWHEAQDKAISKQPPCVDGQWRRMEHQEQAENLRAALTQKDISR